MKKNQIYFELPVLHEWLEVHSIYCLCKQPHHYFQAELNIKIYTIKGYTTISVVIFIKTRLINPVINQNKHFKNKNLKHVNI